MVPEVLEMFPQDKFEPGGTFCTFVPFSFRHKTSLEELQPLLPTSSPPSLFPTSLILGGKVFLCTKKKKK